MPRHKNNQDLDSMLDDLDGVTSEAQPKPVAATTGTAEPIGEIAETAAYTVPKGEEHLYHIRVEKKAFSQATGEKLSRPYVVKFTEREYKGFQASVKALGFTHVEVLHDPTK